MKKIYTVTLSEDGEPSNSMASDMRIVGYFLCSNLDAYETVKGKPIMYSDGIKPNDLLEININGGTYYHFTSDIPTIDNKLLYEPFIISDNSFGFTVIDDESINYDIIVSEVKKVLLSLEKNDGFIHYNFTVDELLFDESLESREEAINRMIFGIHNAQKTVSKKKVLVKAPLFGMLGR